MLVKYASSLCIILNQSLAAAFFVQNVVSNYEQHFAAVQDIPDSATAPATGNYGTEDVKGKETSNLIVLLSELYNFQVISSLLIFDVIRRLLEGDITEFKVELLLKITRSTSAFCSHSQEIWLT